MLLQTAYSLWFYRTYCPLPRIIEYSELQGAHKNHQVQLLLKTQSVDMFALGSLHCSYFSIFIMDIELFFFFSFFSNTLDGIKGFTWKYSFFIFKKCYVCNCVGEGQKMFTKCFLEAEKADIFTFSYLILFFKLTVLRVGSCCHNVSR